MAAQQNCAMEAVLVPRSFGHLMFLFKKYRILQLLRHLIITSRHKAAEAKIARMLRLRVATRIDEASMSDRLAPLISTLRK